MKDYYLTTSPSGIGLIPKENMPVKPVKPPDEIPTHAGTLCIGGDVFGYEKALKKYEAALQRAISEAVPMANETVARLMIGEYVKTHRNEDLSLKIYGPFTGEYEIREEGPTAKIWGRSSQMIMKPWKVAILSEPQEKLDSVRQGMADELAELGSIVIKKSEPSQEPVKESQDDEAFLLHLIDVTACFVMEQNMYLSTPVRKKLIQKAKETFTITRK